MLSNVGRNRVVQCSRLTTVAHSAATPSNPNYVTCMRRAMSYEAAAAQQGAERTQFGYWHLTTSVATRPDRHECITVAPSTVSPYASCWLITRRSAGSWLVGRDKQKVHRLDS